MEELSTIIGISINSEYFAITSPPLLPINAIVFAPLFKETFKPFMTFLEFPLVDIAITISPLSTKLSHCLLKTKSNESSFAIDVIVDVSVESAIAGKLLRDFLNLPKNSAAMCCASAALPPFPKITIF